MNEKIFLAGAPFEESQTYWTSKLAGQLHALDLWSDSPPSGKYEEGVYTWALDNETVENLQRIGKGNDLSLLVLLMAALKIALMKLTGQQDVITASPTYSSGDGEFNKCIVFRDFIHSSEMTFKELSMNVNETITGGYKNQHYPMEKIIHSLDIENVLSLFNVSLVLDSLHKESSAAVMVEEFKSGLIFVFGKKEEPFDLTIIYNAGRFKPETVQRYCEAVLFVLSQALNNPAVKIADIEINTPEELDKLLNLFNDTTAPYPEDKTIHGLFEEQVEQTPDNIALVVPGPDFKPRVTLTYRELNEKADLQAAELKAKGVTSSTVVGLKVEDPVSVVTGIPGILKSGAAYLPLDPGYPDDRIDYMTADAGAAIIIEPDAVRVIGPIGHIGPIEGLGAGTAYVIYTSGTTGRPKGVPISHGGIVNYSWWRRQTYGCGAPDITLQLLSYNFDGFNSNFYTALISGGALVMPPSSRRTDFGYIRAVIRENGVTNTSLVPGMYEALLRDAEPADFQSLRFVVLAGEKAGETLVKNSNKLSPDILLINEYGPSEAAVTAAANVGMTPHTTGIIGKPISNVNIYILDDSMTPVPIGTTGELCITGPGVSSGYLNNPDLTNKKFFRGPGPVTDGSYKPPGRRRHKFYKTGDLARWLPDGTIEIVGRADQQTKIRGFRIEPGEIENRLLAHPAVKEAAVTVNKARDSRENYLSAYLVIDGNITIPKLRKFLALELPGYMIPLYFIQIDEIPLTVNGKIDRSALPAPEGTETRTETPYAAPQSPMEKTIAAAWKDILKKERIGINDNFFEIGGHSLKATIMISKIHKIFNVKISLEDVFKFPTISQLCGFIRQADEDKFTAVEPAPVKDYYPLSPAQRGIYIQHQKNTAALAYNMSQVFYVRGPLEKEKVETTFRKLIERHESFRTSFTVIDGEPVQQIHETAPFKLEYYETTADEAPEIVKSFIRPFDLTQPPLLRAGLIKLETGLHVWMFDMHHTIYDGTSVALFISQFMTLYDGDAELPQLPLQYKDYSQWFYSPEGQEIMEGQRRYWLDQLSAPLPRLDLPLDFPRPQLQCFDGGNVTAQLPEEETRKLLELAGAENATLFMALLTPFYILLAKLSRQEDIIIGSPVASRRHDDLQSIIGVFANNLALRGFPNENKSAVDFLRETRRKVLESFENQEFPFETLVSEITTSRDLSRNPVYDVEFVFQNITLESQDEYPAGESQQFHLEPFAKEHKTSHFDLLLSAGHRNNGINLNFEFATALFKQETVEKFADYYLEIIRQIIDNPRILIKALSLSHDFAEADTAVSSSLRDEWLM